MADFEHSTRRTWLPAEARRRLSVHGKDTNEHEAASRQIHAVRGEEHLEGIENAVKGVLQGSSGKGKSSDLISPNTPLEIGHEFSVSTAPSGHSPGMPSPATSQEVNSKPSLLPPRSSALLAGQQEPLGTSRSLPGRLQQAVEHIGGQERSRAQGGLPPKQPAREFGRGLQLQQSPHKLRTDEVLSRRPLSSSMSEYSSNKPLPRDQLQRAARGAQGLRRSDPGRLQGTEQQENVPPAPICPMEKSLRASTGQPGDIGWRYNQTYDKERQATWHRPSITISGDLEAPRLAPLAVQEKSSNEASLPWPAISPKEAANSEHEARYLEQVAEALAADPLHLASFKEILLGCRSRTISPARAYKQAAVVLAGHPALVEGFATLLPGREQRMWPDVPPVTDQARAGDRREEDQAMDNGRAKLLPTPPAGTPQTSEDSGGHSSNPPGQANQGASARRKQRGSGARPLSAWRALAPPTRACHLPWCTVLYAAACLFIFFYMAGGYGMFKVEQLAGHGPLVMQGGPGAARGQVSGQTSSASGQPSAVSRDTFGQYVAWGPRALLPWLTGTPGWRSFDDSYLVTWGARYLPHIAAGHWWLWATAALVHINFMHLAGNLLPWMAIAFLLEIRFGALRIGSLFLVSLLGAAFVSATLDSSCGLVAGSNGLVAGMVPLLCACFIADWKTMAFPFLQVLCALAAVGLHVTIAIIQAEEARQSHWADLGAFVCGLLPSILFTPGPTDKRWRPAARLAERCGLAVTAHARTCGRKRQRAPAASASGGSSHGGAAVSEERPLRPTASALRLSLPDGNAGQDAAQSFAAGESPVPVRPTKRRLTAPRPGATAHVVIGAPEEDRALRERWAPNSPGPERADEWRQLGGSFRQLDQLHPLRSKEAARPGQENDFIAAHRAGSLHGAVELVQLTADQAVQGMEEGWAGHVARKQQAPGNSTQHRQQPSTESIASSQTSAGTAGVTARAANEDDGAATREGTRRQNRVCSPCGLIRLAFCLVSTVLFLGVLVGLPLYLYLLSLPRLTCPA